MANVFKTIVLLTSLTFLMMMVGYALDAERGISLALVMACVTNLAAYWFSGKIVLTAYRAQPLSEKDAPEIFQIIRELSREARLPVPRLYLIPSASPNAFATGRNPQNAAIAVTEGLIHLLNYEEMRAVLAHELGHVRHRDTLIAAVAASLAGAITLFADMARWGLMFGGSRRESERNQNPIAALLMIILAPVAAALIQLSISRSREYDADEEAARLCGNPYHLIGALRRIEAGAGLYRMREADPASAHLFIINPLAGRKWAVLFSTHPPIEDRIARLEEMFGLNMNEGK